MKYIFLLLFCLCFFNQASATHILGGSLTYQYLGNDVYEIRLEVLRDCFNGAADAQFDDPACIGIYNKFGTLPIGYPDGCLNINFNAEDTIFDPSSICSFPQNVCVSKTVYIKNIILHYVEDGWTLAYQRCCRSTIIRNLLNPLNNGMTFTTHIDRAVDNSSPLFKKNVPYAVFVNTPFVYDASATDKDGDSLAYELATPYFGGDDTHNKPQPPPEPPYELAIFKPPYSMGNMLGGNYPLKINPVTGEMSAIPPTIGSFQIAYAVKEYRNGILIGTNAREFAFVVTYPPPDVNYDVSGLVLINDTIPLDLGKVQIFQRDITTDSLHLYSEQEIGPGASYSFEDIPGGVFYIKAIVDPASIYHDSYLPTYYNSVFFWYNATTINQCDTSQYFRDIHLINLDSFDGVHILDGVVNFAGRGSTPVEGLDLLLANNNGEPIQARTTDENGYFKFEHLPSGTYQLFADLINSPIDNSHAPKIDLSGNTTLQVYLYKDSLSLQIPTSLHQNVNKDNLAITVYPNPSSDWLTIEVKDPENKIISFELLNVNGQKLRSEKFQTNQAAQISTDDLPTGVYIGMVHFLNSKNQYFKIVVTHH